MKSKPYQPKLVVFRSLQRLVLPAIEVTISETAQRPKACPNHPIFMPEQNATPPARRYKLPTIASNP